MKPTVSLAAGAERNPLAVRLAAVLTENAGSPRVARVLGRLYGTVCIVADDLDAAVTLRLDYGRVTLHDDLVGTPDITFRGASRTLSALGDFPRSLAGWVRSQTRPGSTEQRAVDSVVEQLRSGALAGERTTCSI